MKTQNWFEVDKKGLGKLLARKGKKFILFELLQNAWDENSTLVRVTLVKVLGNDWFAGPLEPINDLLIHELGHHYESNHLSAEYYKALTLLGAKLVTLALEQPTLFERPLNHRVRIRIAERSQSGGALPETFYAPKLQT